MYETGLRKAHVQCSPKFEAESFEPSHVSLAWKGWIGTLYKQFL